MRRRWKIIFCRKSLKSLIRREDWRLIKIMKQLSKIIICVLVLFVSANFAQNRTAKRAKKKSAAVQKRKSNFSCQLPPSVHLLELSEAEIFLNCAPSAQGCSDNKIVKVRTVANDLGDDKFIYTVSAGKIIGEGAEVEWDLSGIEPGIYTITAAVASPATDWEVYGMTQTKTVAVKK